MKKIFFIVLFAATEAMALFPYKKYLCISEFGPAIRLIAQVETKNRMTFTVISYDLYPGYGSSVQMSANRKTDDPQSEYAIFSAFDDIYDYYLPFPKDEIENPSLNYFFPNLTIETVGTYEKRNVFLSCAQQI
jgi:hypothetical protein